MDNILAKMIEGEGYKLLHGDCLDILPTLEDNSIDLICTDPPYFKVKNLDWDRQWAKPNDFLEWMSIVLSEFQRVLKPNGSLYVFSSPKMTWGVEGEVRKLFNVLSNIRWVKDAGWHNKTRKEDLRAFLEPSESIIFAEHPNADNMAKGEAGYVKKCDELRGFLFEPLRAYLVNEFKRAGLYNTEGKIKANVACGFSATSGGMASRHYFSKSQWCLPTREHYEALRDLLNSSNCKQDYLRREYDYLRREYEDLRREYEDLRRPFAVSKDVPYTDVWTYKTVSPYKGKHPCEKPYDMIEHIIKASSREGGVVLDAFMGSGVTGEAAIQNNRQFIGIDMQQKWVNFSKKRIEKSRSKQLELI